MMMADDVYKSGVLLTFRNEFMKASIVHALLEFILREQLLYQNIRSNATKYNISFISFSNPSCSKRSLDEISLKTNTFLIQTYRLRMAEHTLMTLPFLINNNVSVYSLLRGCAIMIDNSRCL